MSTPRADTAALAQAVVVAFNTCFLASENTRLEGGAEEPLYLPASDGGPARILFRRDYTASALHEVAHWCIAGVSRRQQPDYGYWYAPDGRDADTQERFMAVEARPQALESLFCEALGLRFQVSLDNVESPPNPQERDAFATRIEREVAQFVRTGLPPRAEFFRAQLAVLALNLEVALSSADCAAA